MLSRQASLTRLVIIMAAVTVLGFAGFIVALGTGFIETDSRPRDARCEEVLAGAFINTVRAQRHNQPFYVTTDRETVCIELALEGE